MSGPLNVLIIGSGGREHALAWKLSQSALVQTLYVTPGNGGTSTLQNTVNVHLPVTPDFSHLVAFAVEKDISLVVPGPEQPLVDGVETAFRKVGIPVFGPSRLAARMEGSKAFSKDFMMRHSIPTARYKTFSSEQYDEAVNYIKTCEHKVVLKASGLAAGKGVLIPETVDEAVASLHTIMVANVFGSAGSEVVIEEYLSGPEISVLAFSDGYAIVPLPAAQDHKRIGDGDTGLNTGGMGAYAPAPVATPDIMRRIMTEALQPTISGMRKEGYPFIGLLFTGFMLTETGPKLLEYNVRFGDPETEALMLLLGDTDLAEIMLACVEHRLDAVDVKIQDGFAVSVVIASEGYPGTYAKGKDISLGPLPEDVYVFHAGTTTSDDKLITSGGRVLAVTALASNIADAVKKAYDGVSRVSFPGMVYRRDIAHRALNQPNGHPTSLTYAQSGVSVDTGNEFVNVIKPFVKSTHRPGSDAVIGGFGGLFDLKAAGFQDPVLVSGTDGVGTKLKIAGEVNKHDTVGIDLVAMSVNDLLVQGAEPLYFLDYYGCSRLRVPIAADVVKGIAEGCRQSNCALIGGETAEMPGMYQGDEYDLAGFAVGAVERHMLLPRPDIKAGDVVLGLPSAGLHSNGFSLVRKIVGLSGLSYSSPCPWSPGDTLGNVLLEPTRIYVKTLLPAIRTGKIKGISHITGGGFIENIPRVLPTHLGCTIDASAWTLPQVFRFLIKHGNVAPLEMARTFNTGVAMVLIVASEDVDGVKSVLLGAGEEAVYKMGEVTDKAGVLMQNIDSWKA